MNLLTIKNKILPAHIIEALDTIKEMVELKPMQDEDHDIFANCSVEAMIGSYEIVAENGCPFGIMVIVDMDRIAFITADEDGIDVMKEFIIKAV